MYLFPVRVGRLSLRLALLLLLPVLLVSTALAHDVTPGDAGYIQEIFGVHVIPFIYLGAKHMITGYDHILFLLGVVFFLYHMKDVAIYVSIFAVGHSVTMLLGVWYGWGINAYIIDAIIGLSVVYKALDNLGIYQKWLGFQPNTKVATLVFGLFHGTGLASKIIEYEIADDGLLANLLAFNVGVEVGQLLALFIILIVMGYWRRSPNFMRQAAYANWIMVGLGLLLTYQQVTGYLGLHSHA
ncbi:MAG: HupE/UreJ family protein [Pseudomonadota bacterium]